MWQLAGCGGEGGRDAQASGMGQVEQFWNGRPVQVGRQLGSHMTLRNLWDIPAGMPRA